MSDEHIQESVAKIPISIGPSDGAPEVKYVFCPRCFRRTGSLKACRIVKLLCVISAIDWQLEAVIACPSCMRTALAKRALISIPISNVLVPIVAVMYFRQYLATFATGHSCELTADAHRRSPDERFRNAEEAVTLWKWPDLKPIVRVTLEIGAIAAIPVSLVVGGLFVVWLLCK